MDVLKNKRKQIRREFTIAADGYETAYSSKDTEGMEDAFSLLTEAADKLLQIETSLSDKWCESANFDEDAFEKDQDKALEYRQRFINIKNRHKKFTTMFRSRSQTSLVSAKSEPDFETCKATVTPRQLRKWRPRLELVKFDGNVKNWLMFWGQFKKIDEDAELEDIDKFQYLLQAMTLDTNARKLVETYPPSGENYRKALAALKARFARDDILIETYVRGLLNLVLMQQKGQVSDLPQLYDNLQTHLQALETLGVAKDKYASVLYPMIESSLPEDLLRTWNRSRRSPEIENDQLTQLLEFLKREVESEERIQLAHRGFQNALSMPGPSQPTLSCHTFEKKTGNEPRSGNFVKASSPACLWCDKLTHATSECHKAAKMTLEERKEFIMAKKACHTCLKIGHPAKRCRSSVKCLFCKKRHMILMCPDLQEHSHNNKNEGEVSKTGNLLCNLKTITLLQTLAVKIVNGDKEVCIRVLIDTGAQRSYIKKDLAKKMGLQSSGKEILSHCLFGGIEKDAETCQVFDICLKGLNNDFKLQISAIEQTNICGFLPKVRSNVIVEQLRRNGIILTDSIDTPDDVSVLIGADYCGLLLTGDVIQLENNLTAIRTKMGWTIQGPMTGVFSSTVRTITTLHCFTKIDLSDLWSLEALGIRDPSEQISKSAHDKEVLESFNSTIKLNEENRYEVRLPWKDMPRPQSNYEVAKKRLMSTTARLKSLGKISDYDAVFREWLSLSIIEEAPNPDTNEGVYMPHHAVLKESSQTTKIRPVFDASAKDCNGVSLNASLEKGANLIELIPELLINFRKKAYGITADIAKAFLQISLDKTDRDYLKFLWWTDVNSDDKGITTFRHRRVVFGVTSSPFHLAATISNHLDHAPEHLKETAMKLKKSFYVDNCVTSVSTKEEMHKFIIESKELMLSGMFDLRCWVTAPEKIDENVKTIAVLGIIWNTEKDSLSCNVSSKLDIRGKITKRILLSVAQSIFDPIGICTPTTIIPKIIIQKAWERKLSWDGELPSELTEEFKRWMKDIHLITEIQIPRQLSRFDISKSCNSIHVFCDASLHAYSACIFIRSEQQHDVDVKLVMAKSRVTPVKRVTIPRLELIAAILATRLAKVVIESLDLTACDVHYWTDSSVVLSWIKGDGDWTTFVTNRVREIRASTSKDAWKHVPSELNPADPSSRGVSASKLVDSQWWEGPSWLYLDADCWPNTDFNVGTTLVDEERKKAPTKSMLVEEGCPILEKLSYFSKYIKIVRTISWMLRFRYSHKKQKNQGELAYEEIEEAERVLIRLIQRKHKNKFNKLQTFVDNDRIIRLETKLGLGGESFNFKAPIVLPGHEVIVERLVAERHIVMQHAGTQTLLVNLRENFWIIGIRKLVKRVVRDCKVCRRLSAKACSTPTAKLPKDRTEASIAFEVSGVDLAGPLVLKTGTKCWIVLFTCATFRAIHLELVESLSANDFIQALRRFLARRGRVKCIYSDNATNFTGVSNSLNALDWNKIRCFSAIAKIKWKFIPPASPWWGGFYERLIGLVKQMLRRVLGRASLTLMELQTVLCDCEATINSRPLSYVSNQPDELKPLTPSMFIQPQVDHTVSDLDEIDGTSLNARARYCQQLRDNFRQRFRNEYLGTLVQRTRQQQTRQLQVGDIVLIESEGKRVNWPLGIIDELFSGADGHCRVAKVRTKSGFKVRSLQRLFPLEIRSTQDNNVDEVADRDTVIYTDNATDDDVTGQTGDIRTSRAGRVLRKPDFFKF